MAVALLGLAFSSLLTLQTFYLRSYVREKNRVQASLAAQYMMTMIEIESTPPDLETKSGSLADALSDYGYFDDETSKKEKATFANWDYERGVTKVEIPIPTGKDEDQDLLRRVDLTIRWGSGADDKYSILYFMKTKPE